MNFTQFIRIFFRDSKSYKHINVKDKESMFFIFNRVIARKFPPNSNTLNYNGIDTSLAMDTWFEALSHRYTDIPRGFTPNWGKLKKKGEIPALKGYSDMDKQLLVLYPDLIETATEELEYNKKIEKEGTIKVIKKRGCK